MFLPDLESSKKKLFLECAYHLACLDGKCKKGELDVIQSFREYLDVPETSYTIRKLSYDEIIRLTDDLSDDEKELFLIGLLTLALVDNKLDLHESGFLMHFVHEIHVAREIYTKCKEWVLKYRDLSVISA